MKIIGLTGGIGTGKTTASKILNSLGIRVVDADQISRSLLNDQSPHVLELTRILGSWVLNKDGTINRKVLGERVFSSYSTRKILENFLHPLIRDEIEKQIEKAQKEKLDILVLDIPLLLESEYWRSRVSEVWLIDTKEEIQKERVRKRDQLNEEEVEARISAQMPLEEKRTMVDKVISNNTTIQDLEDQLRLLVK